MNELTTPIERPEVQIITEDDVNPRLCSPSSEFDLPFYQTRDTIADPERYKSFLKNAERRFRASKEYKMYKSYLMDLGFDHCQVLGNIEAGDNVDIELHHNILNLFDICILISEHMLNTVGYISTFDLIQILIMEHFSNRVGVVFLSTTAHELYTNNPNAYIPPSMTFGKWWELLEKYKYGITYDIAKKLVEYINKYNQELPCSIKILQQEQILNYAKYNEYTLSTNMGVKQIEAREEYGQW
jgi:hypothetical protein